jgi:hypothetical protein
MKRVSRLCDRSMNWGRLSKMSGLMKAKTTSTRHSAKGVLALVPLRVKEGREAVQGECCCHHEVQFDE